MNQFIIEDDNRIIFQSYESKIAEYDKEERTLKVYPEWDYSRTTTKHFAIFINNYTRGISYNSKQDFIKKSKE